MSQSRIPSPARSHGTLTPRRHKPRGTRSVGSPARSTASGRLSAVIQFQEKEKDSFVLSPVPSRRSVLNDDTNIEEPRRKSWWKKLGENSRDVMEVLNDNQILGSNEAVEEYIDIEVLSQEKKNYTIDLPDSSDSESISSIVIPQRKLFTQKDLQVQNKFGQLVGTRESLAKLHKTNVADKSVNVAPKNLFGQSNRARTKPVFPAALLNISPNKTTNKTKENVAADMKVPVRSLFGSRGGTKRKNMFADFIVSESEDEISEIQPKVFGFQKKVDQRRESTASRGKREHSPTSSITTDIEMDEWQHLPSSTMVDNQLEDMMAARTPVKRARLSKLAETKENAEKESEEEPELKYDDDDEVASETNSDKNKKATLKLQNAQYTSNIKESNNPALQDKDDMKTFNKSTKEKTGVKIIEEPDQNIIQDKSQSKLQNITKENNKTFNLRKSRNNVSHNKTKDVNEVDEIDNKSKLQNVSPKDINVGQQKQPDNSRENIEEQMEVEIQEDQRGDVGESEDLNHKGENEMGEKEINNTSKIKNKDNVKENEVILGQVQEKRKTEVQNVNKNDLQIPDDNKSKIVECQSELQELEEVEQRDIENVEQAEEKSEQEFEVAQANEESELENEKSKQENEQSGQKNEESEEETEVDQENEESDQESEAEQENEGIEQANEKSEQENVESEQENEDSKQENEESEQTNEESVQENKDTEQEIEVEQENAESEQANIESEQEIEVEQDDVESEQEIDDNEDKEVEENQAEKEIEDINKSIIESHDEEEQSENEACVADGHDQSELHDEAEINVTEDSYTEARNESVLKDEESELEVHNSMEEDNVQMETEDDEEENNESIAEAQSSEDEEENDESEELQYEPETEDEIQKSNAEDESEHEIQDSNEQEQEIQSDNAPETPNVSHDTTGRNRKKKSEVNSPEAILHDKTNQIESFTAQGRNTSIRKTTLLKNLNIRPSLAPPRESTGLSDGTRNSSAEGSGWDSHRTTRKTLRQTFGRDFTPRKSLRALVIEKSAKRQTAVNDLTSVTTKFPQANSTELPEASMVPDDDEVVAESNHDVSKRTRQTTLEMYLQKIKKQNFEKKLKMEEAVRNSLKAPSRDILNPFKVPSKPMFSLRKPVTKQPQNKSKAKTAKSILIPLDDLPQEVIEDMKYRPPKRFQPSNAAWITKRLYKFLESKLESKYDYKARVRAEKLVETIYHFAKDLRRHDVAPNDAVDVLKQEMARLDVVRTHFDFYQFFHDYMPREIRVKVVPDVVNKISTPRHGVFSEILRGNTVQG